MAVELFFSTFESVGMLLGIGVLGFFILSRGILEANALKILSRLALEVALPSLIFVTILENFEPAKQSGWWFLPVWWLAFTAFAGLITFFVTRFIGEAQRAEFGLSLFYQNATFFPLVILSQLYGDSSRYIIDLFLFVMLFGAFLFSTYSFFFKGKVRQWDWKKVLHPVFLVTLLAIAMRLIGINEVVPGFVFSALELVGDMTVPLLMLILGGSIYLDFQQRKKLRLVDVGKFVVVKNFIFPILVLGLVLIIKPPEVVAFILLLEAAVPPITSAPVLVNREGGDKALVSQFLLGSFLVSLISLPLMVWLFEIAFHKG